MASSLYMLFAVVSVAILSVEAFRDPLDKCANDSWGTDDGTRLVLPDVQLATGTRDFTVTIPDSPGCPKVNGVVLVACDFDAAPEVRFVTNNVATVHRTGNLAQNGVVHVVKYCGTY